MTSFVCRKIQQRVQPLLIAMGIALIGSTVVTAPGRCKAVPDRPATQHGIDTSLLDRSVQPAQDFYRFANGKWLESATIPADKPALDAFAEVALRNETILKRIVEKAAGESETLPAGSEARKIGDFYRTGMDEARAERLGVQPLVPFFQRIAALPDKNAVFVEIGRLHHMGVGVGFGTQVEADFKDSTRKMLILAQAGLGLPDRDYYLKDDEQSKALRESYRTFAARMLELAGEKPEKAKKQADALLALETRLAKASRTRVQMRDPNSLYNKKTLAELQTQTPGLPWAAYFKELGLEKPGDLNVATPEFFDAFETALNEVSLEDWKTYLRWNVLTDFAPYLNKAFVEESFRFASQITGQKEAPPRWRRVLGTTQGAMGEAVGKLFVAETFSPEAKQRAREMILNLKASLRERIQALDWMGPDTKTEALRKLDAITIKVGYPDKWEDYSGLKIKTDSYAANVMRVREFSVQKELAKVGKPVDRSEWAMNPQTVNAYYNPLNNEIVFPAGILQPPFFDPQADDASNYGAIGMVIGHEMTHGFDDSGRQFDSAGNLRDWWQPEDATRFKERAAQLVAQYGKYDAIADVKVNGELTQGENIADLGGLMVAYQAWKKTPQATQTEKVDGFTPAQRFFIAFAQIWRFKSSPEFIRLLANVDTHSPARWRVQGTLVNFPDFVEAFGPGDQTGIAPPGSGNVKIW
ncbi:MAG: M13 family metallopeptidase [Armatimonadaceae bacterium]